ncbi:MAG: hypothetical protein RSE13_22675 [Planktothrix sp. GU0601_MAG3]|nr:MAG: hypothetical protein RSE13_22675 [Planktothrix sp. GU0601_MAG3]
MNSLLCRIFQETELITWINEQQIITKLSQWKSGLKFPENPEQFLEEIWRNYPDLVFDNSDMIEPEIVLEGFYKFILNNWENYKPLWQKL